MEKSMNKVMMTESSSKAQTEENYPEESSWTFYIQDFQCGYLNENNDFVSSSSKNNNEKSASLLSDAASSPSKKANNNYKNENGNFIISSDKNICNDKKAMMMMMAFRKRGIIQGAAAMDEDLQDTASSPVNSPKISHVNEFSMKQKEMVGISFPQVMKMDDTSGALVVEGGRDDVIMELKKRGLCLVPISSVAKYYGL